MVAINGAARDCQVGNMKPSSEEKADNSKISQIPTPRLRFRLP